MTAQGNFMNSKDDNPNEKRRRKEVPLTGKHVETGQYPSLATQAKNLMQTAADVARDPRWVNDEEYEARMKICRECNLFDHKQVRCKKCGCKLKGKARFKAGRCPIQKW